MIIILKLQNINMKKSKILIFLFQKNLKKIKKMKFLYQKKFLMKISINKIKKVNKTNNK